MSGPPGGAGAALNPTVRAVSDPARAISDLKAQINEIRCLCEASGEHLAVAVLAVLDRKEEQ